MGKHFGIRQVVVMGIQVGSVISHGKSVTVSDCLERAANLLDGTTSSWCTEDNEAWIEIDLQNISTVNQLALQWFGNSACSNVKVLTSCNGEIWELKASEHNATSLIEEDNGKIQIIVNFN